ncbi:hypothetical protein CLAIMM_00960 isoform 2 [Cladophialophora immunda]|nr:hypothetical protein CLAIMM_00960 isoform 2 [Cladophialophora immunda]
MLSSPSAVLNWSLVSQALTDQGAAMALISSNLLMMCLFLPASGIQTFREIAMKMVSRSMALLRIEIAAVIKRTNAKASKFLILQIYWLYRVECISRNLAAANVHAGMLYRFIEELGEEDREFKYYMYLCMLFLGVDMTIGSLKRGACDYGPYALVMASHLQREAAPYLEHLPSQYKHPDPIVKIEPLRSILVRARRLIALMQHSLPRETCGDASKRFIVSHCCVIQNYLDTLDLLYMYLDTLEGKNPYLLETLGQEYTHAAVALTIVLVSRNLVDVTAINGVNLRDASPVLIPRLRGVLELTFTLSNPLELTLYEEAHLWILYVGATHEQQKLRESRRTVTETWFSDMLAEKARALGVITWRSLNLVLEDFLYSDFMEPHGSVWFEEWVAKDAHFNLT